MLQRKENKNNNSGNGAKDPVGGAGGNGNKGGGGGKKDDNERKKNKFRSSPMLDYNNHNIKLDYLEYPFGSPVALSFNLTNDLQIDEEILMGLNLSNVDQWRIGIYQRMARPQGGALPPIAKVVPVIVDLGAAPSPAAAPARALRAGRELQGQSRTPVAGPKKNDTDASGGAYVMLAEMPPADAPPPSLNYMGSATITGAMTSNLKPKDYGTGFDIYLLDEKGAEIIGPATFFLVMTKAMNDAVEAETARVPNNKLAKLDDRKNRAKASKEDKSGGGGGGYDNDADEDPETAGLGSGTDGSMVVATAPKLADYVLNTTEEVYDRGVTSTVVVNYDLGPGLGVRRRMQNSGNGNKATTTTKATVAGTTTTTKATVAGTTTTKAAVAGTTTTRATVAGTTTTKATVAGTTTTKATVAGTTTTKAAVAGTTTTRATVAGTTTTKATVAGTTTTKATVAGTTTKSTVAGGPPPAPVPPPQPDAIELIVDPTDVKLFKMGVYMRMAHPQDGALAPIFSMPLCPSVPCTKTADQLSKGTFSFGMDKLDIPKNGYGYDVWVLNGAGAGVAGPKTFYIDNPLQDDEPEL
jgi:hypothetical protein